MSDQLGKQGELLFSQLCAESGVIFNCSYDNDKTGWDHLIEFPQSQHKDIPGDLSPAPIECKVQIKATQRRDRGFNIKLSNMKRLVDYASPAFIFFVEYNKETPAKPEACYLVHIGKSLIRKTLKKLRENDVAEKPLKHHKVTLWVGYKQSNKLSEISGESLVSAIQSHVPDGASGYLSSKAKLKDSIGYEEHGWIIQYEQSTNALREHMLDAAKGFAQPLQVKNPQLFDNRFNIPGGKHLLHSAPSAQVSFNLHTVSKAIIRFFGNSDDIKYSQTFEADVVPVPFPGNQDVTVVLRSEIFSFELNSANGEIKNSICFDADKLVSLQHIFDLVELFSMLEDFEEKGLSLGGEILFINDNHTMRFFSNYTKNPDNNISFYALGEALNILKNAGLLYKSDKLSWSQVTEQFNFFMMMASVLRPDIASPEFGIDETAQPQLESDNSIGFPLKIAIELSHFTIKVSASIVGTISGTNRIRATDIKDLKQTREESTQGKS